MSDYQNILVAVDFSETADHVIKRAQDIARRNNTGLTLLHVVEYVPPIDIAYEPVISSSWVIDEELLAKQAREKLDKICAEHGLENSTHIVITGTPKYEIVQYAEENQCDLIILGSHGRHGIGLLLGSTANTVLHAMPCDILAIKTGD
ncbi:MAG: universal stress protein [Gammaproteobacteria bacterium]|nr:universal stress protein [Gammaproteobacteria bacterium]